MISSAGIDGLLQKLTHTGEISDVLAQVSLRLGRISQLEREIKKLERNLTIRRSQSETSAEIEIEFSSMKRRSKFFVRFELHAFYPFGEIKYKYDNLFGEVSEEEVISAISSVPVPAGFGRLTKICDSIRRLL